MVHWSTGNHIFLAGNKNWDHDPVGASTQEIDIYLFHPTSHNPTLQLIWQPGWIRGLSVYATDNQNVSGNTYLRFMRREYLGGTSYGPTLETTLITIPPLEEGFFCMDPSAFNDSVLRWEARDRVWLRSSKETGGTFKSYQLGVVLEIEEEYIEDNAFDTRPGNRPPLW